MRPRPYQALAAAAIMREFENVTSTLVVMPTGTGKTILFADIIRRFHPRRAIVLAHREELIYQAADKIHRVTGLKCGVEMADQRINNHDFFGQPDVVISTVQTQTAGGDGRGRMGKFAPEDFELLILDEAHHATSASWKRVIAYYTQNPNLKVLGVTATPDRADEAALGQVFQTVAFDYEILDAIRDGWLVPISQQVVHVEGLDYSHIRTTAGDLNGGDLAEVMESENILQRVCAPTIEICKDRRALVFATSVKQAERMTEIFNRHKSECAAFVCGTTEKNTRRCINQDFAAGKYQYLVNVGTHTEGFDDPGVDAIVLARPTKSRALFAQMCGRGTRPLLGLVDGPCPKCGGTGDCRPPIAPCRGTGVINPTPAARKAAIAGSDKPGLLVVDFAGNAGRHKLVSTADILGGNVSDEAVQAAMDEARKTGKPMDMAEKLLEMQRRIDEERARAAANRAHLVAKALYSVQNIDAFDIYDIQPGVERGWHEGKVLSDKQLAILQKQKIKTDGMKYHEGKALLDEHFRRINEGLCSLNQARILRKHGHDGKQTREEAGRIITEIADRQGWGKR